MKKWENCKNILCIRADNMGDLLMSSPAIRALKETLKCKITLLTSSMGKVISPYIKEIDETITADLPWVKTKEPVSEVRFLSLIEEIKNHRFDAAVIFTVYSQNPLPAAMLAYMAGIPKRLAYCRENPYHLLTDWVVEKEPYQFIQHQVERDVNLVKNIGAETLNEKLSLRFSSKAGEVALNKLAGSGVDLSKKWLILHPGVSEEKRHYPANLWIEVGKMLRDRLSYQLIITGNLSEKEMAEEIKKGIGANAFNLAGDLTIEHFIGLVSHSVLVISVNTGTVHIAAATQTPVLVLYALTNPQHTPWKTTSSVLYFSVRNELKSTNQIVHYVGEYVMDKNTPLPTPGEVFQQAKTLLKELAVPIDFHDRR